MKKDSGLTYVVVGAGLNGASIAYHLSQKVQSDDQIIVIEQNPKGVKKSSKGESRISNRQVKNEDPLYAYSARVSDLFYQNLEKILLLPGNEKLLNALGYQDAKLLTKAPCYIVGPTDHIEMKKALADTHQFSPEQFQIIDNQTKLLTQNVFLQLPKKEIAVVDRQAKLLNPSKAVDFMLALAQKNGAHIYYETKVDKISYLHEKCVLDLVSSHNSEALEADFVAIATNCDVAELFPELCHVVNPEPIPVFYFLSEVNKVEDFSFLMLTPEKNEVLLRCVGDVRLYGMTETDQEGRQIIKVGVHDRANILPTAKAKQMSEKDILDFMQSYIFAEVEKYFPKLSQSLRLIKRTICYYGNTLDQKPLLGTFKNNSHLVLLAGLNGNGAKHAPFLGEMATQYLLGQTPDVDLSAFNPNRFL